ncbi:MAG: hypothetical protein KDD50_08245 [Bdellovibrionales bacterium]|nr:hypothetical protein [Bdellovibrionales bacterium]
MTVLVLIVLSALFSTQANAFPEMVRHGYVNCISCHVSPSGGGVLTPYGKALSNEILSTWSFGGEPKYDPNKKIRLDVGGELRAVQTYIDNPQVREGRFILMQADVELALNYLKRLYVVSSIGLDGKEITDNKSYKGISRRHYINYRPTEELSFRAGRFFPAFGINSPNHTLVTRRGLGWDQGEESYNLEGAWLGEKYDVFLTGIFGRPDKTELDKEKGISLSSSYSLFDKYKIGMSYYHGSNDQLSRNLFGLFGILGFTEKFFILSEIDYQSKDNKLTSTKQSGFVGYNRINYEVIQGLHLYLPYQISHLDSDNSQTKADSYGVGIQFFPIKHAELNLEYLKQRIMSVADRYDDFAYLMLHGYF